MSKLTAGIILAAGKGTRMNDDSTNKVCFDCAGTPVIIRLVHNMREAGIERFVIVVGYHADKVMACLGGESGIVYAYQPEQNGTGGAALVGLGALAAMGFDGNAVITMGDKIVSPDVFRELVEEKNSSGNDAVWGVQTRALNENGGRIVTRGGRIFGVVEKPDSAYLALGSVPKDESAYAAALAHMNMNEKKTAKVIAKAMAADAVPTDVTLAGEHFTHEDIESSGHTNAGLYCFSVAPAVDVISRIGSANAQGEVYLTDALEAFALRNSVSVYAITRREQMMTYSTKDELAELSEYFKGK